jgi:hypothetical protein
LDALARCLSFDSASRRLVVSPACLLVEKGG